VRRLEAGNAKRPVIRRSPGAQVEPAGAEPVKGLRIRAGASCCRGDAYGDARESAVTRTVFHRVQRSAASRPSARSVAGLRFDPILRKLSIMEAFQQDTDILRRMSPEQKLTLMHTLIRQAYP
jgi:hypothetical protein